MFCSSCASAHKNDQKCQLAAYICRYGIHSETIQTTVEHVSLYARFVERFCESPDRFVRVLSIQQIDLFERTSVGFYTRETTHFDN